jgi:endonuclease IV
MVNHLSKTKNGTKSTMKKHVKIEHTNIARMYFKEIVIHHTFTMNPTKKQLPKNWKVVSLGLIS